MGCSDTNVMFVSLTFINLYFNLGLIRKQSQKNKTKRLEKNLRT